MRRTSISGAVSRPFTRDMRSLDFNASREVQFVEWIIRAGHAALSKCRAISFAGAPANSARGMRRHRRRGRVCDLLHGRVHGLRSIAAANRNGEFKSPIYVGKAIPKGGRKGGLTKDFAVGRALADRLRQHASSVDETSNLRLADFHVRHLVVDDIWIPLGENMLIETFKPVWN